MATLSTISEKLQIARAYYLELLNADVAALTSGKKEKNRERLNELGRLIRALEWDVADEVNDDDTTALYELLLNIISNYNGDTLSVDPEVVIPDITIVVQSTGITSEEAQELIDEALENYTPLPDRVLTGLEYSYDIPSTTATISAGTYKIGEVTYSASETDFLIEACPADLLKKVRFYATTAGTILSVESTPASVVQTPEIPDGTLGLYEILVNDAGVSGSPLPGTSDFVKLGFPNIGSILTQKDADGDNMADFLNTHSGSYVYGAGGVIIRSSEVVDTPSGGNGPGALIIRNGAIDYTAHINYDGSAFFEGTVSVANPTADAHAVNKGYADATYAPISSVHYRGTYATLSALQTAIPVGNPGDEALVDAGVGEDALKYIWDDSDDAWVQGGGGSAASFATLTGSPSDNAALEERLDEKVDNEVIVDSYIGDQPIYTGLNNKIVSDGNSNSLGYPSYTSYPNKALSLLGGVGAGYSIVNKGVNGQTSQQMSADATTDIDPLFDATKTKNYLFAWEVENDAIVNSGLTAAQLATNIKNYWSGRKAAGFTVIGGTGLLYGQTTAIRRRIKDANTILAADTSTTNYFINFQNNPWLTNNRSLVGFMGDDVHLNQDGQDAMAEEFANKVRLDQGQELYTPPRLVSWGGNTPDRSMVIGPKNNYPLGFITNAKVRADFGTNGTFNLIPDVEATANSQQLVAFNITPSFDPVTYTGVKNFDFKINANSQWLNTDGTKSFFFNPNGTVNNFGVGNNIFSSIEPTNNSIFFNTLIGTNLNTTGSFNTLIGGTAGLTTAAHRITYIGVRAAAQTISVSDITAIGYNNVMTAASGLAVGGGNTVSSSNSIVIGNTNTASGTSTDGGSILIGQNLTDGGFKAIVLANTTNTGSGAYPTADGQVIIGSMNNDTGLKPATWFSIGGNVAPNATVASKMTTRTLTVGGIAEGVLDQTSALQLFRIGGSVATGNAAGGDVTIATSVADSSGSTRQSFQDVIRVKSNQTVGIGEPTSFTAWLNIKAGTTAKAQLKLESSTAPTSPNDGDVWFDGTDLKIRVSGVTKTVTLT